MGELQPLLQGETPVARVEGAGQVGVKPLAGFPFIGGVLALDQQESGPRLEMGVYLVGQPGSRLVAPEGGEVVAEGAKQSSTSFSIDLGSITTNAFFKMKATRELG